MKLGITNTDQDFWGTVEVNTIEDLITLMKAYDNPIILDKNSWYGEEPADYYDFPKEFSKCVYTLEVYDNYRE